MPQGDLDRQKGVYHINAVDEVPQFEVVCCVERISERYLIPALEQLLETFPFVVQGVHSDNGSEYINRKVPKLLEKLRISLCQHSCPLTSVSNYYLIRGRKEIMKCQDTAENSKRRLFRR